MSAAPSPPGLGSQACIRRVLNMIPQCCSLNEAPDMHMIQQELEDGENEDYLYGVCAMQGWRTEMVRWLLEC